MQILLDIVIVLGIIWIILSLVMLLDKSPDKFPPIAAIFWPFVALWEIIVWMLKALRNNGNRKR